MCFDHRGAFTRAGPLPGLAPAGFRLRLGKASMYLMRHSALARCSGVALAASCKASSVDMIGWSGRGSPIFRLLCAGGL